MSFCLFDAQFKYRGNPLQIILHFATKWFSINKKNSTSGEKQFVFLNQLKPDLGHFKLNVDG